MAPEYAMGFSFLKRSNVFNFGILVLEIVRYVISKLFFTYKIVHCNIYLSNFDILLNLIQSWKLWNKDNVLDLIDLRISSPSSLENIMRCIHMGLLRVQEHLVNRPSISTVPSTLSCEIFDLLVPQNPEFTKRWNRSRSSNKTSESANNVTLTMLEGR